MSAAGPSRISTKRVAKQRALADWTRLVGSRSHISRRCIRATTTTAWLTSCDDDAMSAGANLALIGGELIQFADVTPLGGGRFRLARLMRGRAGTESAIPEHAIDEAFCVIEAGSLQS